MQKLVGYCLNPEHHSGKHKARVFKSRLGLEAENAEQLRELIQNAAIEGEVVKQDTTDFAIQYQVDWAAILRRFWMEDVIPRGGVRSYQQTGKWS